MNKSWQNIMLVISLLCACIIAARRISVERSDRTVGIAIDYNEWAQTAERNGNDGWIPDLKKAGAVLVVVSEDTLSSLESQGRIRIEGKRIEISDPSLRQNVKSRLEKNGIRCKDDRTGLIAWLGETDRDSIGLGFDARKISAVRQNNMLLIARVIDPESIEEIRQEKPYGLIYLGNERINPEKVSGFKLGMVEFEEQNGIRECFYRFPGQVIRVHLIADDELEKIRKIQAIRRWQRAVLERNFRMLYVFPMPYTGWKNNLEYISEIKTGIENTGYRIGEIGRTLEFRASSFLWLVSAAGILMCLVMLIREFIRKFSWLWFFVLFACLVLLFVSGFSRIALGQSLAFLAVLVFSVVSLKIIKTRQSHFIVKFLSISAVSSAGGLLLAGAMSDTLFMLRVEQFRGTLSAHILPFLLVMFYLYRNFNQEIKSILDQPAKIRHLLLGLLAAVAFGIAAFVMLVRLKEVLPASALEREIRLYLEDALVARPRFKEFLIGHPLMILGLYLLAVSESDWQKKAFAWLCVVCGIIGQVSILNTFCHLHTPLCLTLLRVFNGLWSGIIIGLLLVWLFRRYRKCTGVQ